MYDKLEKRAQSTVRQIYISPIVQKFKLKGRVSIGKLEDRLQVRKKINNNIYEWLNDNADFSVNIQKSNISQLIDVEPEVVNSNIYSRHSSGFFFKAAIIASPQLSLICHSL